MAIKTGGVLRTALTSRWKAYVARRGRAVVLFDVIGPAAVPEIVGSAISWPAAIIGALILFVGIPLVETVVYLVFKWGNFKRSFKDAFLVNLITTLVGFGLVALQPSLPYDNVLSRPGSFLVVAFVLSVAIEGAVLMRLKRQSASRTWLMALFSNVVSYAALYLLTVS